MYEPKYEGVPNLSMASYLSAINTWISKAFFFFIVVPNDDAVLYSAIKKRVCVEVPIPSQVLTMSKVLNKV